MYVADIAVEEGYISEEEWAQFISERQDSIPRAVFQDKRGTQAAVPENPALYMTRLQLARIRKMEEFGWELMFVRRAKPSEALVVMHLPGSGKTAAIQRNGDIDMAFTAAIRASD